MDEGFDIKAVIKRLHGTYPVEESLPFQIRLMLAHLLRAECERAAG